MKKIFIAAFSFLAILFVQSQPTKQDDFSKLRALNAKFIHNFVTNDTFSHSKIIHSAFICISSDGQTTGRKEYMKNWLHGFDRYVYWDYRNEHITLFGNTALVRSQNRFIVVKDGKEISGMSMYTDTYVKENGEWKCVQAQIGKVTPENYASDETIVRKYDYRPQ